MSSTTTVAEPEILQLHLRYGPEIVTRNVSTKPVRECTLSEVPIVDLAEIDGDLQQRTKIADAVRHAAGKLGFFYIKNHGIDEAVIQRAQDQALRFFEQPREMKEPANRDISKFKNNGWSAQKSTLVSPGEDLDFKEGFGWSYSPEFDPMYKHQNLSPGEIAARNTDEPHIWSATSHLEGFKEASLEYWSACVTLARKLIQIFALSLDLPESYFDNLTTFPGADGVFNYYPATPAERRSQGKLDIGLGAHTDFQCFTLLWQDMSGGLQILNKDSEWIWATPIEGTFVVNIGDFLARLTNDRYNSTVHRAYNRGLTDKHRLSMPFFFGFNYDAECAVLPTCTDADHPAKYKPISCGRWREIRFGDVIDSATKVNADAA